MLVIFTAKFTGNCKKSNYRFLQVQNNSYFVVPLLKMKILSPAISKLARMRQWRIDNWSSNPIALQRQVLQDLISKGQYTAFGKAHQLNTTFTIRAFKSAIPIQTFETLTPYINRMLSGEQNVLWNADINWFAKSSGTSNQKSKFIPISQESLQDNHFQASKDVLSTYYSNFPSSDLLTGKSLVIGGSHQISEVSEGISFGDLSAVLLQNSPFWGQWIRTPELSIALLDEWEEKIERLAISTATENVTSLAGVPTWTLILLKRILQITGKQNIKQVWPNLELYIHGGVSFTPYAEQFNQIIGAPINYLEIYNASEGFIAAQQKPNDDGMLLFTEHGIFYEFLSAEEFDTPNPRTIGLDKVVLNKNYALVISTTGGLWRYLIGDTIMFTSLQPYKIKVTGRVKHYINAFGEELMIENADTALAQACTPLNAAIVDYTAAPIYFNNNTNGAHEWVIEFSQPPADIQQFALLLDAQLKIVNSDYEAKRQKNIALNPPVVHIAPTGTFNTWLKQKGKLGGQHKVPRLSNNRDVLTEVLQIIQNNS
jgi:hypothetical protein